MEVKQLPTEVARKVLLSTLVEQGFDPRTLHYEVLNGVEGEQENWMGSVYKVAVYSNKEDSSNKLSLFIKCLIKSAISERLRLAMFFENEVNFFDKIIPGLMSFQEQSRARVTTPFTGAPKCFKAMNDGQNDVIILEDLTTRGFTMLKRLEGMKLEETRMMFEELGRFHGLSLAMKDQKPDEFSKLSKAVKNVLCIDVEGDPFRKFVEVGYTHTVRLMEANHPHDSTFVTKAKKLESEIFQRMLTLMSPDPDDRFNVICHGDLWINNFMFRFKGESSEKRLKSVCFLDFQTACYASLGVDLICALYTTVDQQTRDVHRDELLHAYHDALCKLMTELGSNPEEIIPFSSLEVLLKKCSLFGVGVACMTVPTQLYESTPDDLEGPDGAVQTLISVITDRTEKCKKWLIDLMVEVTNRGYLI